MKQTLLMESVMGQTRLAVVEDGALCELYIERPGSESLVGSICVGRVTNVLPGMGAAFVDIGQEKAAYLYVYDVYNKHEAYMQEVDADAVDDLCQAIDKFMK